MQIVFGSLFRCGALVLLFLTLASATHASHMSLPMGYYIREAELIVIADTHKGNNFEIVLLIREVIKGDANLADQTIEIQRQRWSSADARIPLDAKNVVIMLRPGWKEAKNWPVLEAYSEADELEAAHILVPICMIEDERSRLLALRATLANGNAICRKELFAQLRAMREAGNFDLITDLYPALEPTNQVTLIELVGDIGDPRGLPILITATASPDKEVSRTAVDKLRWDFPGYPGVAEAMRDAVGREHLRRVAAQYLARYNSDKKLMALAEGQVTPWVRAMRLLESGKKVEGRSAYLEIVKDKNENFRTRLNAASLLIPDATAAEKEQIQRTLLPLLARERFADDYILATDVAKNLRALHHPDCMPALLSILRQTSFTHTTAAWMATIAICELGGDAQQKAVIQITEALKSPPPKIVTGENSLRYPLELIWLGNQKNFEEAGLSMHAQYAASWKSLRPLQAVSGAKDEVGFLVQQLSQRSAYPEEATEWIMLWLGDLKDPRAIPELLATFVREPDWMLTRGAVDALVAIGGREVEAELTKLLTHEDENRVRRHATEAMFKLLGDNSRDLALRVTTQKGYGWKPAAYLTLGKVGIPNDLKLLLSLSDYWTGDRTNHYWAMSALQSVRERCNYDMNGPIKTAR